MKKLQLTTLFLSLIASVPVQSNEVDSLVNASQSIRDSFKSGIQAVGGLQEYAPIGGIAPTGTVSGGYLTYGQAQAYNDALAAVQNASYSYDSGAQEWAENQANQAMNEVNMAVDTFVQAAQAVITVAEVNERAQDAQEAGDDNAALELQEFITDNDVTLNDADVDFYNDSLDEVEKTAQQAAAYFAIAGDETLLQEADDQAKDLDVVYADATSSFFDASTGQMSIVFAEASVTLGLGNYFKSVGDIYDLGAQSDFFKTSPEGECWFAPDYEACLNGTSGS